MDTLEKIREVRPLTLNSERKYYEPISVPHHHVVCDACGKVHDIHADLGGMLQVPRELASRFEIRDADILFKGLCSNCLEN
jgi:Fe2+ or Zn2+ uptake regulation protein